MDTTFPQDQGTSQEVSADEADHGDAADFAAHAHVPNATNFVVSGFTLSPTIADREVSISDGQARILVEDNQSINHGDGTTIWSETTHVIKKEGETLTINDGENHIWLDANIDELDSATFTITAGEDPGGESLKIGIVDTTDSSTQHTNREPDGGFGSLTVDELATIERAAINRLAQSIDADGSGITNLGNLTTEAATVESQPENDDHVARKAEVDERVSKGDAARYESGGSDELSLEGLEGETNTPQPAKEHNNSAHSEEFVSPETAQTALEGETLHTQAIAVPSSDLSSISLSASDDGGLFHHDGTSTISTPDGNTSSATGYYRYRYDDNTWVPIGEEAVTLDGHDASAFALIDGDTFSGPVNIETITENALFFLKAEDPSYFPELGMGNEFDQGAKMRYYESDDQIWFGNFSSTDGFDKVIGFDLSAGEVVTDG